MADFMVLARVDVASCASLISAVMPVFGWLSWTSWFSNVPCNEDEGGRPVKREFFVFLMLQKNYILPCSFLCTCFLHYA